MSSITLALPLTIDERRAAGAVRLNLAGKLDLTGAAQLTDHLTVLRRSYRGRLVVDLRDVTVISSAAVAVLLDADAYSRRGGWVLELVHPSPPVQRTVARLGLLGRLPLRDGWSPVPAEPENTP
jgi:anti-anti-sigma factor